MHSEDVCPIDDKLYDHHIIVRDRSGRNEPQRNGIALFIEDRLIGFTGKHCAEIIYSYGVFTLDLLNAPFRNADGFSGVDYFGGYTRSFGSENDRDRQLLTAQGAGEINPIFGKIDDPCRIFKREAPIHLTAEEDGLIVIVKYAVYHGFFSWFRTKWIGDRYGLTESELSKYIDELVIKLRNNVKIMWEL